MSAVPAKRTRVGSGRARRPLPMGREAVERAIAVCELSGRSVPSLACVTLSESPLVRGSWPRGGLAGWLPEQVRRVDVFELRAMLESMP